MNSDRTKSGERLSFNGVKIMIRLAHWTSNLRTSNFRQNTRNVDSLWFQYCRLVHLYNWYRRRNVRWQIRTQRASLVPDHTWTPSNPGLVWRAVSKVVAVLCIRWTPVHGIHTCFSPDTMYHTIIPMYSIRSPGGSAQSTVRRIRLNGTLISSSYDSSTCSIVSHSVQYWSIVLSLNVTVWVTRVLRYCRQYSQFYM